LNNRVAKVRPGLVVPETGVKNANCFSVQRFQLVAKEALVMPDDLKQFFRDGQAGFAEEKRFAALQPPIGVTVGFKRGHRHCFSIRAFAKSSLAFRGRIRTLSSAARSALQFQPRLRANP
jgi:hypothetical protein